MDEGQGPFVKRIVWNTTKLLLLTAGTVSLALLLVGTLVLGQIPSDKEIRSCMTTKLYNVHLCPNSDQYVRYGQISPFLIKAVVLTEDSAFWQHNGFDFSEMQKSLETNLKRGKYARGGSTITQQLAKNLFLSKEKTLSRKGFEALITMRLEKTLTKKEILEKYLNVVQFGAHLFGIKSAASFYFGKSPAQLDVVESAFLAFLLPSPEKYSKSFFKKQLTPFAQVRLTQILDHLYQYDRITAEQYEQARMELQTFLGGAPVEASPEIEGIDEESAEDPDLNPET